MTQSKYSNLTSSQIETQITKLQKDKATLWEQFKQMTNPADKEVLSKQITDITIEIGEFAGALNASTSENE